MNLYSICQFHFQGYNFGVLKLDVKTKTATGVDFNSNLTSNTESGQVGGRGSIQSSEQFFFYLYAPQPLFSWIIHPAKLS